MRAGPLLGLALAGVLMAVGIAPAETLPAQPATLHGAEVSMACFNADAILESGVLPIRIAGRDFVLELEPELLDLQLVDETGAPIAVTGIHSFSGHDPSIRGSRATVTVHDGSIHATVMVGSESYWMEPVQAVGDAEPCRHVSYTSMQPSQQKPDSKGSCPGCGESAPGNDPQDDRSTGSAEPELYGGSIKVSPTYEPPAYANVTAEDLARFPKVVDLLRLSNGTTGRSHRPNVSEVPEIRAWIHDLQNRTHAKWEPQWDGHGDRVWIRFEGHYYTLALAEFVA